MTSQNTLKRRIRARMEKTGESYTTARRAIVGTPPPPASGAVPGYTRVGGGTHHDSALVSNVLHQMGVTGPHNGEPFSETMLIGLGGGIGVMYFVFEYEGHLPMLSLILRHHPDDFVVGMLTNAGIRHEVSTTSSPRLAAATLSRVIEAGRPAICRVTAGALPYDPRQPIQGDHYEVGVIGFDSGTALIDDEAPHPHRVTLQELADARAFTKKEKHRLIEVIDRDPDHDFATGIRRAIAKTIHNLTEPVMGNNFDANFGFRGLEKLADELESTKSSGWRRRFTTPDRQFAVLHRMFTGIELEWGATGGLRPAYADFLDEAASVLDRPDLIGAAGRFRAAGKMWQELADLAVPSAAPGLGRIREVMDLDQASRITGVSHPVLGPSPFDDLRAEFAAAGGLAEPELASLLDSMAIGVRQILDVEREAVGRLAEAIG